MADQNQPQAPQVGVVGQQGRPQQGQPAPAQQGVPGVQQPPVPSPEQIAKVMEEQRRQTAKQIEEARRKAGYADAPAQQSAPANNRFAAAQQNQQPQQAPQQQDPQQPQPQVAPQQGYPQQQNPMGQIPADVQQQMPPQMRPQPQQPQQPQQPAPSPVQGLTAEQVLAGPPNQEQVRVQYAQPQQPQPQYAPQPQQPQGYPQQGYPQQPQYAPQPQQQPAPPQRPQGGHIAAYANPQEDPKETVPWFPVRGAKDSVDIELTDYIIKNVPSRGIIGESNPTAKLMLALFGEILALREQVQFLMQNSGQAQQLPQGLENLPQRVYNLEATLFEQRQAMNQRARGVREQVEMARMQGLSPEQILATLTGQQVAAEQMTQQGNLPPAQHIPAEQQGNAQATMVAAGTGQAPQTQQVQAPQEPEQQAPPQDESNDGE